MCVAMGFHENCVARIAETYGNDPRILIHASLQTLVQELGIMSRRGKRGRERQLFCSVLRLLGCARFNGGNAMVRVIQGKDQGSQCSG